MKERKRKEERTIDYRPSPTIEEHKTKEQSKNLISPSWNKKDCEYCWCHCFCHTFCDVLCTFVTRSLHIDVITLY